MRRLRDSEGCETSVGFGTGWPNFAAGVVADPTAEVRCPVCDQSDLIVASAPIQVERGNSCKAGDRL
jgi:hypothetical protein